jgi:hypothetical protein
MRVGSRLPRSLSIIEIPSGSHDRLRPFLTRNLSTQIALVSIASTRWESRPDPQLTNRNTLSSCHLHEPQNKKRVR